MDYKHIMVIDKAINHITMSLPNMGYKLIRTPSCFVADSRVVWASLKLLLSFRDTTIASFKDTGYNYSFL